MKLVFWAAAIMVIYAYFGYILVLYLRSKIRPRLISTAPITPSISIIIAVRNESQTISAKLQNLIALDYPAELIEIIVVSDGSTDQTNEILAAQGDCIRAVVLQEPGGKATAINAAVEIAKNEIVVFTDARQSIEPGALKVLVANFADKNVGAVSGELVLRSAESDSAAEGIGIYWKLEKKIRGLESAVGSVVGATGAFYAVRRALLVPLPANTILDDVYTPMHVIKAGFRVVLEPNARAWDVPVSTAQNEFRRKVRTLTGNYQLVQLAPWIMSPKNPLLFEFISHKFLRLLVPFALFLILLTSVLIPETFYRFALAVQVLFYAFGLMALMGFKGGPFRRLADVSMSFLVLNAAAAMAFGNRVTRKQEVWTR